MNENRCEIELVEMNEVSATPDEVIEYYTKTDYTDKDFSDSDINKYIHAQPKSQAVLFKWRNTPNVTAESKRLYLFNKTVGSVYGVYEISGNAAEIEIDGLYTGHVFCWYIETHGNGEKVVRSRVSEFKTKPGRRIINLEGAENARDLGGILTKDGIEIKQGLLYRSSELDTENYKITENGVRYAAEFLKIKTELDLRKPEQRGEIAMKGESTLGRNVNYLNFSCAEYDHFIKAENGNEADIIRVFADIDNYPLLFHCVYGADRTGTVAYLLEVLCGIEIDGLTKDYELTAWRNRTYEPYTALVKSSFDLPGESLSKKIYKFFNEKLGVSKMEISNIKNILTTNSAVFKSDSLRKPLSVSEQWAEFRIDFRNSLFVKQVFGENETLEYKQCNDKIAIKISDCAKSGKILFNDGKILEFEV